MIRWQGKAAERVMVLGNNKNPEDGTTGGTAVEPADKEPVAGELTPQRSQKTGGFDAGQSRGR